MKNGHVFITGVSSGIGKQLAKDLLLNDYSIIGSVRSYSDAQDLADQYPNAFKRIILDVTKETNLQKACEEVIHICRHTGLLALINNAGISVSGPLGYIPIDQLRKQLDVNLISVIEVIQRLLPVLGMNHGLPKGKIINMGSVSGLIASPFVGAYAISKHGLRAASDSLRRELNIFGISVSLIEAGPVKSLIWSKAKEVNYFNGTPFEFMAPHSDRIIDNSERAAIDPMVISNTVLEILNSANPKPRYLVGRNTFKYKLLAYWLPDAWVDKIIFNRLKKRMK